MEGNNMQCPKCQFENREGARFCGECRHEFEVTCPECGTNNRAENKFCDACGYDLSKSTEAASPKENEHDTQISESPPEETIPTRIPAEGERKHVTVLFSDLTGYTAMSEKMDPEEVKELMNCIFSQITKVVHNYSGFIEKFAGDAVMAIFGVPQAHEDDPIRAIKAAREIHSLVKELSPAVEKEIGQRLSMHSGINTGLVVTGEVNPDKGTHGVSGDALNLASRLSDQAQPGEILIGQNTYHRAEGHFRFEDLEPIEFKGKTEPVKVYKVLSLKEKPITTRRLSGVRSDLVGRKVELAELSEAVENLKESKGRLFSICGDAGTGKSRLVEEFKATLDLDKIQWIEGHAYAYAQNIPYFPLIDFLNRVFHIEEGDPAEIVKAKLESGIEQLVGNTADVMPYVGGLYSLEYPEREDISPEFWKSRLHEASRTIFSALAKKAPTVFFLEDLHWADPSFVELLRQALLQARQPAIVLCAYRPGFNLFTSHQVNSLGENFREIRLQDLSLTDAQDMLESLLETKNIPSDLKRLVQSKAEGNPFYLEELINSLIESEMLVRDNSHWKITRAIAETDISSSIHGLISGRLDRLETGTKRILQEAAVIGRAFLYDILQRVTELQDRLESGLGTLERQDLIRTRSFQPDLEYIFKHPLTQEVVYNGLLKKERQEIHEQIARVMETVFQDRLSEFHETLAFHYARGKSIPKAVDYLVKSGKKSLARYSVDEAHQYYQEAYGLLTFKEIKSEEDNKILLDILNSWGYVFYYRGDAKNFVKLYKSHRDLAESLNNPAKLGMFYVWFGIAIFMTGKIKDSYEYLCKALELGEESGDQKVVGYACTWLTWACAELCLFEEGIGFGERAQEIAKSFPADQYLFYKSLAGISYINFFKGDKKRIFQAAEVLIDYGKKTSNNRSLVFGFWVKSWGYFLAGDAESALLYSKQAVETGSDPYYVLSPKIALGSNYFLSGQFLEAENTLQSVIDLCEKLGLGQLIPITNLFLAPVLIVTGRMKHGLRILESAQQTSIENQMKFWYIQSEYILGKLYSQMATGPTPALSTLAKNIGFLVKNAPLAVKKAEAQFTKTIELSKKVGTKGLLGSAYLDLGLFYQTRKKINRARGCLSEAIKIFEENEADGYLKQAKKALDSL
jgi:class 3 adenylate cyclase/tetratricopeptide (TPR) repeat protein